MFGFQRTATTLQMQVQSEHSCEQCSNGGTCDIFIVWVLQLKPKGVRFGLLGFRRCTGSEQMRDEQIERWEKFSWEMQKCQLSRLRSFSWEMQKFQFSFGATTFERGIWIVVKGFSILYWFRVPGSGLSKRHFALNGLMSADLQREQSMTLWLLTTVARQLNSQRKRFAAFITQRQDDSIMKLHGNRFQHLLTYIIIHGNQM